MRKLILLSMILLLPAITMAASSRSSNQRVRESYVDTGKVTSIEITLSAAAGTVSTVTIPSWAKGFRLYPRTNHIRFSVREVSDTVDVVLSTVTTSSILIITSTDPARGGIAKANLWETRLLPFDGTTRTIHFMSATASVVLDLEFF